MNILHVLSQFEVTGAEVYAITLADAQRRRGHTVTIVSDTLTVPFDGEYISQPIGNRSYRQRWKNISYLTKYLRQHHVDLIHAHSRAASWVSFFAARRTRTPFVSTVHGRQHVHASSRSLSIYGNNIIAVSRSLKNHLVEDLGISGQEIVIIPNGLEIERWTRKRRQWSQSTTLGVKVPGKVILFAGRLSGPKGDVVRYLLSEIFPNVLTKTRSSFHIIGSGNTPPDIAEKVDDFNRRAGRKFVFLHPYQEDILPFLRAADIVIASGRVAMESLAAGKPTVAFGESEYAGLVTEANFVQVMESNFGDTGPKQEPNKEVVIKDFAGMLTRRPRASALAKTQKLAEQNFDMNVVKSRVEQVYRKAIASTLAPHPIPVLMYHRVVKEASDSRHGIWVTEEQFGKQLASLHRRGFSTITFQDYAKFLNGETRLPGRPIVITFDDGYEDNYLNAFPVLKRYRFSAVIFLVTDTSHRTNFWDKGKPRASLLSERQIREMSNYGVEFGSHTMSHPILPQIPLADAEWEIVKSKQRLERIVGRPVISFAYPYGRLNDETKEIVKDAGYSFAVAADSGPLTFHKDLFEIRRTQVFPWTDGFGFWKKTQSWYTAYKSGLK